MDYFNKQEKKGNLERCMPHSKDVSLMLLQIKTANYTISEEPSEIKGLFGSYSLLFAHAWTHSLAS